MFCGRGIEEMKNKFKMIPEILKNPDHFENRVLEGRIILKCVLLWTL